MLEQPELKIACSTEVDFEAQARRAAKCVVSRLREDRRLIPCTNTFDFSASHGSNRFAEARTTAKVGRRPTARSSAHVSNRAILCAKLREIFPALANGLDAAEVSPADAGFCTADSTRCRAWLWHRSRSTANCGHGVDRLELKRTV